ncbi:MAG: galactose-1-epimerase, partial [Acetobacteraceae bacterium]|nr:galactose-1-epimerase [Acetobacteraceae bacterium]
MADPARRLTRDLFGTLPDGRAVERVVLRGAHGFEVRVITFGAALQALITPDADGHCDDIVLGHNNLAGYLAQRRFFGATVGRYANRIANARFLLDGEEVQLAANDGQNALHGGIDGFDRKLWQITDMHECAEPGVT